jgi:hypothetical protein
MNQSNKQTASKPLNNNNNNNKSVPNFHSNSVAPAVKSQQIQILSRNSAQNAPKQVINNSTQFQTINQLNQSKSINNNNNINNKVSY